MVVDVVVEPAEQPSSTVRMGAGSIEAPQLAPRLLGLTPPGGDAARLRGHESRAHRAPASGRVERGVHHDERQAIPRGEDSVGSFRGPKPAMSRARPDGLGVSVGDRTRPRLTTSAPARTRPLPRARASGRLAKTATTSDAARPGRKPGYPPRKSAPCPTLHTRRRTPHRDGHRVMTVEPEPESLTCPRLPRLPYRTADLISQG